MGTLDCFATLAMTDKMDCRVALAMTSELIATIFLRKLLGGATFIYALFDNKTNCVIIKKRIKLYLSLNKMKEDYDTWSNENDLWDQYI